jgi:hypothetical protein
MFISLLVQFAILSDNGNVRTNFESLCSAVAVSPVTAGAFKRCQNFGS